LPASNSVLAVIARCPPAEKPMMPMRAGSMRQSVPCDRTTRMARCASPIWIGWW
jgi:hypothetical protein